VKVCTEKVIVVEEGVENTWTLFSHKGVEESAYKTCSLKLWHINIQCAGDIEVSCIPRGDVSCTCCLLFMITMFISP
jgi:hypothetical protein